MCERILGSNRCDKGSPLHTEGPTTENARAWVVEVRAKGTKSSPCSNERSELRPLVPVVGQQRSHIQTWAPIRNMIRCWRGSQWSTSRTRTRRSHAGLFSLIATRLLIKWVYAK